MSITPETKDPDYVLMQSGKVSIAPNQGQNSSHEVIMLAGFASRKMPFNSIYSDLEANLIVIAHNNTKAAFLSLDLLFVGKALTDHIHKIAKESLSIDPASILICASHTHFAPATDASKPKLGKTYVQHLEYIKNQIITLFKTTKQSKKQNVLIEKTTIQMHHAVNRRRKGWHIDPSRLRLCHGIYMAPNFKNTMDNNAQFIKFIDKSGKPQAYIWSYACHPTSFPDLLSISADYPGIVRKDLRKKIAGDVPVVFLQGLAGDKRPLEIGGKISLLGRIRRLIGGPHFGKFDLTTYTKWAQSLSDDIVSGAQKNNFQPVAPSLSTIKNHMPLSDIIDGKSPQDNLCLQKISLGKTLNFIALSAEVVADYGSIIAEESKLPLDSIVAIGYIDDVFGYLPTQDMIRNGGYEATDFFPAFNLEGKFKSEAEIIIRQKIKELAH